MVLKTTQKNSNLIIIQGWYYSLEIFNLYKKLKINAFPIQGTKVLVTK